MKKTIIALMALAGVAIANDTGTQFNTALTESITLSNYTLGDAFTIEIELYVKNAMDRIFPKTPHYIL